MVNASVEASRPRIRRIGPADLVTALAKGIDDFRAKPSHILFLSIIYPVLGLLLSWYVLRQSMLPLVFPLIAGFALIGPFAALIFYEMSRRREQGQDVTWLSALGVLRSVAISDIAVLGAVLAGLFVAWCWSALAIYAYLFPDAGAPSFREFVRQVLETPTGRELIVIGCGVGALYALVVLAITVVSFPMLLDRKVNALTAVQTSVAAVLINPITMLLWGIVVAVSLALGSLPFLVGLAVVVPVLGHATWHLYRKVVD